MLPDGFYVLTENVANTVCGDARRRRWEYLKTFKAGMAFRVATRIPAGTKHLVPVKLYKGWNIAEGPLFALIAAHLTATTIEAL